MSQIGVLLLNIGTPDSPAIPAVRRYLREFLGDPYVIDLPAWQRWVLLNFFILPFRPKRSAVAYQKIWTVTGSPLLNHSQQLRSQLAEQLGERYYVVLGMRYGQPSIESAIHLLQQQACQQLIILPLFPQYSAAASGSILTATLAQLQAQRYLPKISLQNYFFAEYGYIQSFATVVKENLNFQPDYYLFSFHGIPERQLKKSCFATGCDHDDHCPPIQKTSAYCYRAQCYTTSRLLADELKIHSSQYKTTFQSRLGTAAWIQPYTTQCLINLAKQNIKKLVIVCPSFIVDCLETLEEIGIRAREQWYSLGGESLQLIPALNAHAHWIQSLIKIIKEKEKMSASDG